MRPKNWTPSWRSFQQTGNPDDIVSSPTVAAALGQKVDAENGQAAGLQLDENSTWGGRSLSSLLPSSLPTALASLNGTGGVLDGSLSSVSLLPGTVGPSTGTGIVRVEVFEGDHSDHGRAVDDIHLATLFTTLRNWAERTQQNARLSAQSAVMGVTPE